MPSRRTGGEGKPLQQGGHIFAPHRASNNLLRRGELHEVLPPSLLIGPPLFFLRIGAAVFAAPDARADDDVDGVDTGSLAGEAP